MAVSLTRHGAVIALVAALSAPADAQPLRTWEDPSARDFDADAEQHSRFWERAVHPNRDLYESRVKRAQQFIARGDKQSMKEAAALLADAIDLEPEDPRAYWELGLLYEKQRKWKRCADTRVGAPRSTGRTLRSSPPTSCSAASHWTPAVTACASNIGPRASPSARSSASAPQRPCSPCGCSPSAGRAPNPGTRPCAGDRSSTSTSRPSADPSGGPGSRCPAKTCAAL